MASTYSDLSVYDSDVIIGATNSPPHPGSDLHHFDKVNILHLPLLQNTYLLLFI